MPGPQGDPGPPGTTDYNVLTNLPTLGNAAAKNTGTGPGDVSAGNHAHAGVYEPANANIQAHVVAAHAQSDAQKNSDITKAEIEAKLTGQIASHSHAGGGGEAFPVGSVFLAVVGTNPGTLLGYGTWSAFGAGRMLVGLDSGDVDFDTAEETGGAKTSSALIAHTHIQDAHTHIQDAHSHVENQNSATTGGLAGWGARDTSTNTSVATGYSTATAVAVNQNTTATNQSAGSGSSFSLMSPYIVVYMWKRTA